MDFLKQEKVWSAFKYFESTDSGYITADSVIDALKACGLAINEEELKLFFQDYGKKGKKLDFTEFKKIVMVS
jgi:Ca2+-binding EF-hand superfamily protein